MRLAASLAMLALVTACAVTDPAVAPAETRAAVPATPAVRSAGDDLGVYLVRLRAMSEAALATEAARYRRDTSDLGRVKSALALSFSSQSDEAEILALVDPVAKKDNGEREVRAMASFLQVIAHERRRLKESAAAAGARLRDERRLRESEKQRADALQQKLDALTELEKSLSDRPSTNR